MMDKKEYTEKCTKFIDLIKETIDLNYPDGIESAVIATVFLDIVVQISLENHLSKEELLDKIEKLIKFHKEEK